jgi:HAD superfamily hydrolase (TIGR01509 family)
MAIDPPSVGAVFDLDGVLIDSHDQHQRAWFLLAEELKLPMTPESFKKSFGMRNEMAIAEVFGWTAPEDTAEIREISDRKEIWYRKLVREERLAPLPGVIGLLKKLRGAGIPCSLGSSTPRENIDVCLAIAGIDSFFGAALTGAEDVRRGKPHPEVFLQAAEKIGRDPARCFVIEDAHVGIEAGRAAGMKTVAVTTTHPAETFSNADMVVDSLAELEVETLLGLFPKSSLS